MSKGRLKEATECSENPLNNAPHHIETKQSLCIENQLPGFYMTQVFIESNFRTNSNSNSNTDKRPNHQTKNDRQSHDKCREIVKTICVFNANIVW